MANNKGETWFGKAAEKMVRENKTLLVVATEMELNIPSRELMNIERRKSFQQLLWTEKNKYYKEIASDPQRDKNVLVGQMTLIVDELMREGKYKDAAEAILKLAKIVGYVGVEGTVNVFANMSASEFEEARRKIKTLAGSEKVQ